MGQFGSSTISAIVAGVILAIVAFVPVVAHRYRATGRLRLIDLLTLLAVAVYAMALWTYTLIPIPASRDYHCAGVNLSPFAFVDQLTSTLGQGSPLRNAALLQAGFNVVLFLPLGAFLRLLARRGVVVATGAGLGVSALIEVTQLTGVWGLFPCAYRVFDVDDLILNTAGALLGSLVAWPFARLIAGRGSVAPPTSVTVGRRLVGVLIDVTLVAFISFSLVVGWRVADRYALGGQFGDCVSGDPGGVGVVCYWAAGEAVASVLGWLPVLVVEGWSVLASGRTCGEAIVALRPVERGGWMWLRRLTKFVMGVGGYVVLTAVQWDWNALSVGVFVLASLIAVLATKDRRGLSGLVAGLPMAPAGIRLDPGPEPDPT